MLRCRNVEVVRGRELTILADRALCPTDAGRVDQDAQWAKFSCLVDRRLDLLGVGDVDADECAADFFGKFCPRSTWRSATTTLAPLAANCRADAAPIPDAPPVTIALTPLISTTKG
jgi:hypothetical protein